MARSVCCLARFRYVAFTVPPPRSFRRYVENCGHLSGSNHLHWSSMLSHLSKVTVLGFCCQRKTLSLFAIFCLKTSFAFLLTLVIVRKVLNYRCLGISGALRILSWIFLKVFIFIIIFTSAVSLQ